MGTSLERMAAFRLNKNYPQFTVTHSEVPSSEALNGIEYGCRVRTYPKIIGFVILYLGRRTRSGDDTTGSRKK